MTQLASPIDEASVKMNVFVFHFTFLGMWLSCVGSESVQKMLRSYSRVNIRIVKGLMEF